MSVVDDLLAGARDALAYLRKNGIPSHIDDHVTEQLCDAFESLDALLSAQAAMLPQAWAAELTKAERKANDWCEAVRKLCVQVCGEEVAQRGRWIADIEAAAVAKSGRPWLDNAKLVPELHAGGWEYDIRVCVGTSNVVEIDKFYGPLVAQPVRVSIESDMWIVERMVDEDEDGNPYPGTSTWIEVARFPIDGEIR